MLSLAILHPRMSLGNVEASEGGCVQKAPVANKQTSGPRRRAWPRPAASTSEAASPPVPPMLQPAEVAKSLPKSLPKSLIE